MAVQKVLKGGRVMWRARVVIDGRQRTAFRTTRREALEADAKLKLDRANPKPSSPSVTVPDKKEVPTLRSFTDDYLKKCRSQNRPQWVRKKEQILESQLLPVFGDLRLEEIRIRRIEEYRSDRISPDDPEQCPVGPKWVNAVVGVLMHVLRTAADWEIIDRVPKVEPLYVPPPEFDFLSDDEADRLVATAGRDRPPWAAMILTALRTGLRLGELRGLQWRYVDVVAGRLLVRWAADEVGELHPPKNGRPREVPLGDDVLAELKAHRHLRRFVFDDEDGSMLTPSQCRKALDRATRRASLRPIGWHVLRHSFASALVARGVQLKAVKDLLGHETIAMTLRYAHLAPDVGREAARSLDRKRRGVTVDVTQKGEDDETGS